MKENTTTKEKKILEFTITIFLIFIGVIFRFFPHPPNFTPIGAIALFGGAYLSGRIALVLPLLAMLISDLFLGFYSWRLMLIVYLSFLICVLLGFKLKKNRKWYRFLGYSLIGSVVFYLLTNFAVWAFTSWYPKNLNGLLQCYFLALPFFKNTILGNLFYTGLLFGAYEGISVWIREKFKASKVIKVLSKK
jgi:hypothetical protein